MRYSLEIEEEEMDGEGEDGRRRRKVRDYLFVIIYDQVRDLCWREKRGYNTTNSLSI